VDEADSVFIDEASTPAADFRRGPNQSQIQAYEQAARLAAGLDPSTDYRIARINPPSPDTSGKQHLAELAEPLGGCGRGQKAGRIGLAGACRKCVYIATSTMS
jgi:hypothetical protein